MTLPNYEIYAIKYARRDALRLVHFVGGDPHNTPMPMDYFAGGGCSAGRFAAPDRGGHPRRGVGRVAWELVNYQEFVSGLKSEPTVAVASEVANLHFATGNVADFVLQNIY